MIARNGGVETSSIPVLRLHVVDVPAGEVSSYADAYAADPDVASVDRDRTRDAEATPSDPAYGDQWSLPQIGWDQVYGSVQPSGFATLAVLDTGVAPISDLSGHLVPGWSAFGSDPNGDPNGHGTWLSSIAAADTNNAEGIAGVAYDGVKVMPVQVLDASGQGQDSDIIAGLAWAVDHGANVMLMGFSNPGFSDALQAAVDYAWSQGVVLVAATGNDGSSSPTYPAGDSEVVGVSATDQTDALWIGSNYGGDAFLAAPGVSILADDVGGGTTSVTGTSAAAAHVAAAAALLKSADPSASNGVIVGRLARNADVAGTADQTGNGRLNLARAITDPSTEEVVPAGAPGGGPLVGPYVAAARNLNITFAGTGGGSVVISQTGGTITYPTTGSGACTGATGTGTSSVTIVGSCNLNLSENNTPATLTATADGTSAFAGWTATLGTCSGTSNPCSTGVMPGGQNPLTVTFNALRHTSTSVVCSPDTRPVGATSTCTATVTDDEADGPATTPTGDVDLSVSGGAGDFTPISASCTLSEDSTGVASCSVDYTPSNVGTGTHTITGDYQGDDTHKTSSGSFDITVNLRSTSTTLSCSPVVQAVGSNIICTATVTDTESIGTKSAPSGTVTFTRNGSPEGSCPLVGVNAMSSSCSVTYTSSFATVDSIVATYGGSDVHAGSTSEPVFIVFYDANGGFVTGGGWIMSPPGACQLTGCLSAAGKAIFGFVSKYQKGATVPTGNTEFQFQAGDLNFKNTSYDWLVVTGSGASRAQYKGSGTINGAGDYGFMLTAIDGGNLNPKQPDRFRIKIWDKATGTVVYDNQLGAADSVDPTTVISGGSIVIHK